MSRCVRRAFGVARSLAIVLLILGMAFKAAAGPLYWDPGYTGTGGAGVWDATSSNWDTGSFGGASGLWDSTDAYFTHGSGTVTVAGAVNDNSITIGSGSLGYTFTGGTINLANASTGITAGTISVAAGSTGTFNSTIAGSTGLTFTGGGTLVLAGANGYTGGTTIAAGAGTLDINSASALGAAANVLTINGGTIDNTSGAAITTSAYPQTWSGNFAFGGTNALNLGAGAVTLTVAPTVTVNGTGALTVGGIISGTGFGLTKLGTGALTLSGVNTFSGGLAIQSGTVTALTSASALGAATGSVTLGVSGGTSAATLLVGTTGLTYANPIVLATGAAGALTLGNSGTAVSTTFSNSVTGTNSFTINENATTGTITLSGSVNNAGVVTNAGAGAGATAISGIIGPSVAGVVENSATSMLNLSGASTFTGGLTIKSGTVNALTSANALGANTNVVTLGDGSTPNSNSATLLFGTNSLTFAQPIALASRTNATGTLTIGITASTVGTVLSGGVTGNNDFTVVNSTNGGTGRPSFTGLVNNSGKITLIGTNSATTAATTFSSIGSNVTSIIENSSGYAPLTVTALAMNSNGTTLTNSEYGPGTLAVLTVNGGITGAGNLILNNNSVQALGITLSTVAVNNAGTITNQGTGTGDATISAAIGSGTSGLVTAVTENSSTSQLNATGGLVVASPSTTLINSNAAGSQLLNLSGAVSGTGNLVINNSSGIGAAISTVGGTTGGITLGAVNNIGAVTNSGAGAGPVYITGAIGASVTAINQNSATSPLVITGGTAGATTGTVTIAANSTLQLGNQAANNLALGTGTINDGGTLIFAPGTTALTYPNVMNGAGNVTLNGLASAVPATIVLSATTGTFSGSYTLNQGRIQISAASNLGASSAPILVNGNSTAYTGGQLFMATNAFTVSNPITINGYGPTEAAGNLGAIRLNLAGQIYSGPITLGSNASIDAYNIAATVSGLIAGGSGAQLLIGTPITGSGAGNAGGTLTLTNTNTYSGGTLIQGETAALGAVGALGTGPITLATTSSTGLTESVANALTGANSLTVNGGTATLSTANNYNGTTSVNGGTLTASVAGAVPSTSSVSVAGGTLNNNAAGAILGNISVTGGTLAQTGPLNGASQSLTVSGGTANLSQANSYGGGTTINAGTLNATAAGALPGAVTVNAGTLIAATTSGPVNSGTINLNGGLLTSALTGGTFGTVLGGSTLNTVNPAGVGTQGSINIANLTTGSGTVLQFDNISPWIGAPATTGDLLNITSAGGLSLGVGTTLNFTSGAPTNSGEYRLFGYAGSAPSMTNLPLPASPRSGLTYAWDTTTDPGYVDLAVTNNATAVSANWLPTAASSFSWNNAANWDVGAVPSVSGDTATLATTLAVGAQTITLDSQPHVGALTLNPGGTFAYTISAGAAGVLALDNGAGVGASATLQNLTGNNAINAPVTLVSGNTNVSVAGGTTLTVAGAVAGTGGLTVTASAGSLVLSGSNTFTGGVSVNGGLLSLPPVASLAPLGGAVTGTGSLTLLNGGTFNLSVTTGTTTMAAGQTFTIGAGGGTIIDSGAGTAGKLLAGNVGNLAGPGTLTKSGGADMLIFGANTGFTGNVNLVGGYMELQNAAALGSVGTITLSGVAQTTPTGTTTNGSTAVTVANTAALVVGQAVTGAGIPAGAYITNITNGTTFQISSPATATGSPTLTIAAENGEAVASAGATIPNPIVFSNNLGILSAFTSGGTFSGPVTVPSSGAFTIASRSFTAATTGTTVSVIGPITGGAALAMSATQTSQGLVILGGNNANWTTTQGSSTNPFILGSYQGLQFDSTATTNARPGGASGVYVTFNGATTPTLGLASDGSGTGTPDIAATYTDTLTFTTGGTILVGRAGLGIPTGSSLFTQAANKTIVESNAVTFPGQTISVTNNNGYGLAFTGNVSLTGTTTLSVANASASNVVPGLTLSGPVSSTGTYNLVKTGAGTLLLTNTGNSFGGSGTIVDITGGFLAFAADSVWRRERISRFRGVVFSVFVPGEGLA